MADIALKETFPGHDGDQLAARLDLPVGQPKTYAIFAHCFTCSKDVLAATRIASALADRGVAVLRFDFTGLGHSDGEFANTNFSSNVADLVAAAGWLRERRGPPQILIGHSLGGAAVLAAAESIPEVRAVVTIGAPADASHVVNNFNADLDKIEETGAANVTLGGRTFTIRKQFLDDLQDTRARDRIAALNRPLLIFHAPRDETVGIENAGEIFAAAKHPKSFVSLDDADHMLRRSLDATYVADVLAAWAMRYVVVADAESQPSNLVTVSETGASRFQQSVRVRGHSLIVDEPPGVGGGDTGPTPYDFVSMALGACTTMTLRMYANRKGLDLGKLSVTIDHAKVHAKDCAECAEGQEGRIDRFERVISVAGDPGPEVRAKLVEIAGRCPVHRTLESSSVVATRLADEE